MSSVSSLSPHPKAKKFLQHMHRMIIYRFGPKKSHAYAVCLMNLVLPPTALNPEWRNSDEEDKLVLLFNSHHPLITIFHNAIARTLNAGQMDPIIPILDSALPVSTFVGSHRCADEFLRLEDDSEWRHWPGLEAAGAEYRKDILIAAQKYHEKQRMLGMMKTFSSMELGTDEKEQAQKDLDDVLVGMNSMGIRGDVDFDQEMKNFE